MSWSPLKLPVTSPRTLLSGKRLTMGMIHPAKIGLGSALELIARRLRADSEDVAREPLPERWVDLIKYLDEQERRSSERKAQQAIEDSRGARRK